MDQPQPDSNIEKQQEASVNLKSLPFSYKTNGLDYYGLDGFRERELEVYINKHVPKEPGNTPDDRDPYGTHITHIAANKMVKDYWCKVLKPVLDQTELTKSLQKVETNEKTLVAENQTPDWEAILKPTLAAADDHVIFSREVINWLLAQQHCVGIKFYFCLNHKNERSLALVGVDKNNHDLGAVSANGSVIGKDFKNTTTTAMRAPGIFRPEGSPIIEVGGPNNFKTLWDAFMDKSSAYGDALREFISSQAWVNCDGQAEEDHKNEE